MPRDAYIAGRCSDIEDTLQYASDTSDDDSRLGALLAAYASVLISGVVEDCVEHMVIERARRTGDQYLQNFVKRAIDQQFRNPRSSDIANLLKRFGDGYATNFQDNVKQEAREALDSIVNNRLSLAHQGELRTHLTVGDVQRYFTLVVGLLESVEDILL